jgi:Tfp pilus assembly pilus retraction ATPase PilT
MDPSRDLDRIVEELNARPEAESSDSSDTEILDRWLATLQNRGASDLLLVPGAPACVLIEGGVRNIESEPLTGPEIESIVRPALSAYALKQYRAGQIADSSYRAEGLGRFRINLHRKNEKESLWDPES